MFNGYFVGFPPNWYHRHANVLNGIEKAINSKLAVGVMMFFLLRSFYLNCPESYANNPDISISIQQFIQFHIIDTNQTHNCKSFSHSLKNHE